ncbi:MAG: hypothetical protein KatS3mg068_1681 [Candidatus Sericytochromatia bacterium]|nr:MAG: hypothetical protein KatS3mg068_1681 [Candidatus Sericytochromatia bacterium]
MKKITYFLLLPLILSCSLNNNLNTSSVGVKNSFKLKGSYLVQDNELTYKGNWNNYTSSNYNGNNMTEANNVIENTNSSLVYSGSWTNYSNGAASASSFHYTK